MTNPKRMRECDAIQLRPTHEPRPRDATAIGGAHDEGQLVDVGDAAGHEAGEEEEVNRKPAFPEAPGR